MDGSGPEIYFFHGLVVFSEVRHFLKFLVMNNFMQFGVVNKNDQEKNYGLGGENSSQKPWFERGSNVARTILDRSSNVSRTWLEPCTNAARTGYERSSSHGRGIIR